MEGRTCIVCGSEVVGWLSFTVVLLWNFERFGNSCADVQNNQQLHESCYCHYNNEEAAALPFLGKRKQKKKTKPNAKPHVFLMDLKAEVACKNGSVHHSHSKFSLCILLKLLWATVTALMARKYSFVER